jgi:hypothetical protein
MAYIECLVAPDNDPASDLHEEALVHLFDPDAPVRIPLAPFQKTRSPKTRIGLIM